MNPIFPNIEPKPSAQCRRPVAGGFVKALLAGLLLVVGYFGGYPERFAQEALGHNSKAVHRSYAKKAKVT